MQCLLIEHIMNIMMLTGAGDIDMYVDGGDDFIARPRLKLTIR